MLKRLIATGIAVALLAAGTAVAQQRDLRTGSVVETVQKLKPGEYVWAPRIAPAGPMLLIVNLANQRAILFRNGVPIGATTISTGRPGYSTPTGVFTILQKHVEHYSSKYDSAPMPYMQRLTWYGIALHAGKLPGLSGVPRMHSPATRLRPPALWRDEARDDCRDHRSDYRSAPCAYAGDRGGVAGRGRTRRHHRMAS